MSEELLKAYRIMQDASGIKVGDTVKVLRKADRDELGWKNTWDDEMSSRVGRTMTVTYIRDRSVGIELTDGWMYPFFVLEKVADAKPVEVAVDIGKGYTAVVKKNSIVVGCQTFDSSVLQQLNQALLTKTPVAKKKEVLFHITDINIGKAAMALMLAFSEGSEIYISDGTTNKNINAWFNARRREGCVLCYSSYKGGVVIGHCRIMSEYTRRVVAHETLEGLLAVLTENAKSSETKIKLNDEGYEAVVKDGNIIIGHNSRGNLFILTVEKLNQLIEAHNKVK